MPSSSPKKTVDIRSFFGTGGGGGGAAKPKAPSKAKGGGGAENKSSTNNKDAAKKMPPGKRSPAKQQSKGSSSNKGTSKMSMETKASPSNSKGSSNKNVSQGVEDSVDDAVEVVVPQSAKRATAGAKRKKEVSREKEDSDGEVEVVASPRKRGGNAPKPSSPGVRRRMSAGGGRGSPSPASKREASPKRKAPTLKKVKVSPVVEERKRAPRRRAVMAVNYRDDDDGDEGIGGSAEEEEEFSGDDGDSEEEEEGGEEEDSDDELDDEDDFVEKSASSRKKRKPSASSSKKGSSPGTTTTPKKKKMVIEEDEEDNDEQPLTSSRHFAPSSSSSKSRKKSSGKEVLELEDTSSDEKEEPEATPPPRKKKPVPVAAKAKVASPAADAEGDNSAKKKSGSGGGGGGGFRPPWMGGGRKAPPNEGKKDVPVGADQCLTGKVFVVSGVLDSLGREAAEDLIKQYGGKVTGSVSGRTTYLLLGSVLDDGRPPEEGSKYRQAQQHKTKIIDEDDLFQMLRDSNPKQELSEVDEKKATGAAGAGTDKAAVDTPFAKTKPVANPYNAMANPYAAKKPAARVGAVVSPYSAAITGGGTSKGAAKGSVKSPAKATAPALSNKPGQMWVDKHKPRTSSDVIGHAGQVKKLKFWLQNWERWHLGKFGVKPPTGKDNPGARAALLSGVPGVGKSSTATLVAREMGYHVTELNASDTRNKSSLSIELASVIGNHVLSFSADSGKGKGKGGGGGGFKKQLVIMDEVDGMGGSDRGGIQELILLIKKSKVPIIAICNDRQHQKIRSLVNHCYDLRFARPQKATIAKRVRAIAKMEGMDVDDNAAEMLVEANGNDIRQVLHALQMWNRKSSKLSYMNLKGGLSAIEKDKVQRCGPFDAARSILGGGRTPFRDRFEAFFTDYSLLPLLIHQNYLSSLMNIDPKTRTDVTACASAAVSDADIISGKMRGDVQHWELLPTQAALNVRVGSIGGGSLGFPEFPKWLGNYSRENKRRRLLGELATHLNASISGGTEAVRLSYLHFLKSVLTRPLKDHGADGAQECIELLEEYGLSRDDLFEIMPEFQLSTKGMRSPPPDVFASLDGKTKSAVTRAYNATSHKSQALVETMQAPKKSKKRKAPPKSLSLEEDEEESQDEGEEEDGDDEDEVEDLSAFRKKGKSQGAATKGKASAAKPKAKKGKK